MTIVVGPTANLRIQQENQMKRGYRFVRANGFSYTLQKFLNTRFRRLDKKLPIVFTDIEPEKIKPFFNRRN